MTSTLDGDTLAMVEIVRLLRDASDTIWRKATEAGPRSCLHLLGVGMELALARATDLLPADLHLVDLDPKSLPTTALPQQYSSADALQAAEALTRALAVQTPGLAPIVVELCDLIREAQAHGL